MGDFRHNRVGWHPLLGAGALFLLVLSVASPLLFHADNLTFCHALYLNEAPSPHWVYPGYLLSYALCKLAPLVPWLNVYLLYLYVLIVGSVAAVLHVACPRGGAFSTLRLAGVAVACYIVVQVPMKMEYAWISFLAAGCGCMLVFHAMYRGELRVRALLPGLLLFMGGALLRYDSCPGFVPFIGVASLFGLWRCQGGGGRGARWGVPALLFAMLAGLYLFQPLPAEGVWQGRANLLAVNSARMAFCDYPDRSGLDKTAEYRVAGIDPATVELVEGYFCCDDSELTPEWWETAARIRREDNPRYALDTLFCEHTAEIFTSCWKRFLLLSLLALWGAWIRRGRWRLYPLALCAAYFLGILACCLKLRCHFTPIMSLAYFYVPMLLIPCGVPEPEKRTGVSGKLLSLCCPAAALATVAAFLACHSPQWQLWGGFGHKYGSPAARAALVEWVQNHPDQIFLAECYTYRSLAYPAAPLFHPKAPYIPRVVEWGNWPSTLPYRHEHRASLGIDNEVLAALRPDVRLVAGPEGLPWLHSVWKYLRARHGCNVRLEIEQELPDSYAIYRIVETTDSPN